MCTKIFMIYLLFCVAPVANVTTDGNTWLKHGDMLNLQVGYLLFQLFKTCICNYE